MPFFQNLLKMFTDAEGIRDKYTGISIQEILGWIREAKELRFYIDATDNFGHQASTIHLMKRLIDETSYSNNVKIVYNDINPEDTGNSAGTPGKLAILLTGLNPSDIDQAKIEYGTCKNITFLNYAKRVEGLKNQTQFGFTGGADDMNINYATELKVEYFLRLQPYLWDDEWAEVGKRKEDWETSRVEQPSNKYFYLPKAYDNFIKLAYKFSKEKFTTVNAAVWKWYSEDQTFSSELKIRTKNIKAIYDDLQEAKKAHLWPLYGLHQFISRYMGVDESSFNELSTMAMNFVLTAFQAQKTIKKPIVIFSLNKPSDVEASFNRYIPAFAKDLSAKSDTLENLKAAIESNYAKELKEEGACSRPKLNAFVSKLAQDVKPFMDTNSKITLLVGDTDISGKLSKAISNATNNELIIALIGPVPVDIYNYFYANCQIPGVFEGQGTSSLVISLGRPFLQLIRDDESIANNYPSTLASSNYSSIAQTANAAGLQLRNQQFQNYLLKDSTLQPAEYFKGLTETSTFITNSINPQNEIYKYFAGLGTYYQKNIHDKLMLGLVALDSIILGFEKHNRISLQAAASPESLLSKEAAKLSLEDVFNQLTGSWSDGGVSLIAALPKTYLTEFFSQVTKNVFFITVEKENIKAEKDGENITKVTLLNGTTTAFAEIDIPSFNVSLTFTAEDGPVVTTVEAVVNDSWNIAGIPWIGLEKPGFFMKVNEGGIPVQGGLTGTVKGTQLALEIVYPTQENSWLIKGGFDTAYPSIDTFYQMAGGINLVQSLPSPLCELGQFGLKNVELMYNQAAAEFSYMSFEMTTPSPWTISQSPLFQITPTVTVNVNNVQDVANREIMFLVTGSFTIGSGTITVNGGYPNFELYGGLSSGKIMLSDLLALFGGELELSTAVTKFNFAYKPEKKYYQIGAVLEDDKPLHILELFTINNLSFNVESRNHINTVALGGACTILPDSEKIDVSVSALYSTNAGWTFSGQQTSGVVSIGALFKEYIGWDTGQTLGINGLGLRIETKTNAYEFTAKTADPWSIPFLVESIDIEGKVKLGCKNSSNALGSSRRKSKAEMPPLVGDEAVALAPTLTSKAAETGYYGEISAEIQWNNIDLIVAYNFDPSFKCFEVTWGELTGKIEEKLVDDKKYQVATLAFTKSTTLGGMIEIMVSWATGSKFSLSSPWNLLDKISLSNFALVYNFTNETVEIKVNIGPIDLGFATINSIGLSYEKASKESSKKSVMIDLDAKFIWGDSIPKWDATKPESAPSPEGSGNKYLDLRMLAVGQHVTFDGFSDATTVQKAIELMAKMPEPKSDQLPAVTFDADSSWLFAADFGVLRIKDDKDKSKDSNSSALVADNASKPQYVVTLQTIFNDPNLYALRVALDGDAAKIFKGLDFQIMYRKLSDTLGVYQSEITLPDIMRHLSVGAYSVTLPVFGIEIYTNGDFNVDIGFPWNEDFARSFTIEAIVPPGIPLTGSGGIYFGKLPQVVADVPVTTKGHFNPILVLGFGAQLGLGKSIEYGLLKAGFSLTVFGILEGLLAKWNPYDGTDTGKSDAMQIQGEHFFRVQGTFGVIGKIYGSVDFAIVKADVSITVKAYAQITFASYEPIPLSVVASVDATASVSIDLGLFSIRIHFSFSVRVKETFVIGALQNPKDAPWLDDGSNSNGRLSLPSSSRLGDYEQPMMLMAMAAAPDDTPVWSRLTTPGETAPMKAYLAFAPTVAGDEAFADTGAPEKNKQLACCIASLFIESVPAATGSDDSSARKAAGEKDDSSFETLAKTVARWGIASIQSEDISSTDVDKLVVTDDSLKKLLTYLEGKPERPVPLPYTDIETFLENQVQLTVSLPPNSTSATIQNAAFFPMAVPLTLDVPGYNGSTPLNYSFELYNSVDDNFIGWLRTYFNQLAVQVQTESNTENGLTAMALQEKASLAQFVFGDYFLLIMKQMIQALRDGLRTFKYLIKPGDTGNSIVKWVGATGNLNDKFTLHDLFEGNADHKLNPTGNSGDLSLIISGATHSVVSGESFDKIADSEKYKKSFKGKQLAVVNVNQPDILTSGQMITLPGKGEYQVDGSATLQTIADTGFADSVTIDELLDNSNVLTDETLLAPFAPLCLPNFSYTVQDEDTLNTIASNHGIDIEALSITENGQVSDLLDTTDNQYLDLVHLPQFQVGELIKEAQRTKAIEHLSGMASRYYLHGLRLPTDKIVPNKEGMWVKNNDGVLSLPPDAGLFALTGQQFCIPSLVANQPLNITLTRPSFLKWLAFDNGESSLAYPLKKDGDLYNVIDSLHKFAIQNALDTELKTLGAESMVVSDSSAYPLSTSTPCQIPAQIYYPEGGFGGDEEQPRLWYLPDAMQALPPAVESDGNVYPEFALQVHRYSEATGTSESTDVQHYGWATSVAFTIKHLPSSVAISASSDTYEIMGADGKAALLLERMAQIENDNAISLLTLGYTVKSGSDSAFRVAMGSDVTMGISQSNLSTTTQPPAAMLFAMAAEQQNNQPSLLNTKIEFIQFLWKASITRNGGFYLYFNEKEQGGLPESIFNDKGESTLTLFALYSDGGEIGLRSYMNAALIGDPMNLSSGAIIAKAIASQSKYNVAKTDSPTGIAKRQCSSILSLAQNNPNMALSSGVTCLIADGTYQVSDAPPGGKLNAIATHFNLDPQSIKDVNPRITWSPDLTIGSTIRLPQVDLTIGDNTGDNTMSKIADFYGTSGAAVLGANETVVGLIDSENPITVSKGPFMSAGTEMPGVQAIGASRSTLPELPEPTDPKYAKDYLLRLYTLLGYRVLANQDFVCSKMGLPLGPKGESSSEGMDKIRYAKSMGDMNLMSYAKGIPYTNLVSDGKGGVEPTANPYQANGRLLQMDYSWNDLYGNRLVTKIDEGTFVGNKNPKAPVLTGYTDNLVGLSQWPGTSSHWTVAADTVTPDDFLLQVSILFDPSPYNKPNKGDSDAWKTRARVALVTYEKLLYQLTDPNGIAILFKTGLLAVPMPLSASQVGTLSSDTSTLVGWLVGIVDFLKERANGNDSNLEPTTSLSLSVSAPKSKLNTQQIFVIDFEFVIQRTHGIAEGDFAAMPAVREISTPITPLTIVKKDGDPSGDGNKEEPGLNKFAQNIEDVLSRPDVFRLTVGTGEDRSKADAGGSNTTVWAVRLGDTADEGIHFSVDSPKSTPQIFAPRPVSNQLQSRTVDVYPYSRPEDFNPTDNTFTTVAISKSFADIDVDNWVRQFFTSLDNLLSPEYLSSILVIDKKMTDRPEGITSFEKSYTKKKKALAAAAKILMAPVFSSQESSHIESAQEALYQKLLEKLSNLYSIRAAVSVSANVNADAKVGDEYENPQLYGNVTFENSVDDNGQVVLTSPKLALATKSNAPLTFLVEAPALPKSTGNGIETVLPLDLKFEGCAIEHQITGIKNVDNYKASTWLGLVRTETAGKWKKRLGKFDIPMFIRSFPATPRMDLQTGEPFKTVQSTTSLADLSAWNYSFTYSQDYHYPQDRVYGQIEYNLNLSALLFAASEDRPDAFRALAQFISVKPEIEKLLKENVSQINAETTDKEKINDAVNVLAAYLKMVTDVIPGSNDASAFTLKRSMPLLMGNNKTTYKFFIEEGSRNIKVGKRSIGDDPDLEPWVVKISSSDGVPPVGLLPEQRVSVDMLEKKICRNEIPDKDPVVKTDWSKGIYAYWYSGQNDDGTNSEVPIRRKLAQTIQGRKVTVPGLNILENQDAKSTIYLKRNEELLEGRPSADAFVYQTPDISFTNSLLPTIDHSHRFDISTVSSVNDSNTLAGYLSNVLKNLFGEKLQSSQTIQLECQYAYSVSEAVGEIRLPVLFLPPLRINPETDFNIPTGGCPMSDPGETFVCKLSNRILHWFNHNHPTQNKGEFQFDLTVMSHMTVNPMPLIRLRTLYLEVGKITPNPNDSNR